MSTRLYYTGVGARETPRELWGLCSSIARDLESLGYVLRSGGARGADQAFEEGVRRACSKQIFDADDPISAEAWALAKLHHPKWYKVRGYARRLHARNGFQVLGPDLNEPSDFLVCWTPDAAEVGGTVQAIRIAKAYRIPVYNIADENQLDKLRLERLQSCPVRATN